LGWILLLGVVGVFCVNVYPSLTTRFDHAAVEQRYMKWMANPRDMEWFIGDNLIYALAGWKYVHGVSPDQFNYEHPPLAKYIIGLSEVLFNNENVIGVLLGVTLLFVVYQLAKALLRDPIFALLPVYALSLERLFIGLSSTSMLDIYYVFFLFLSLFFFITGTGTLGTLAGSVALGMSIACKVVAGLAFIPLVALALAERRRFKTILFPMAIVPLVYVLSYVVLFMSGRGLPDFVEVQLKMFGLHYEARSAMMYPSGRWLLTFLTGIIGPETRFLVYVNGEVQVVTKHGLNLAHEFNPLTWPLCFSASILSLHEGITVKRRSLIHLSLMFLTFLAFLSVGPCQVWHLFPLLPVGLLLISVRFKRMYDHSRTRVSVLLLISYVAMLCIRPMLNLPYFLDRKSFV
jgi:hypothetical protein